MSLIRPVNISPSNISGKKQGIKIQTDKKTVYEKSQIEKKSFKLKPMQVSITGPISIQELSNLLVIPAPEIIKSLFLKGISVTVNQIVDTKLAKVVGEDYGVVVKEDFYDNMDNYKHHLIEHGGNTNTLNKRSPIVTVLGHVDHGKTTLLDTIRKVSESTFEEGGITQTIMAHEVYVDNPKSNNKIIFLDTPGHKAFTTMRARGMQVTDLAVIVVAADDGLKPQSIEMIDYLQKNQIPLIIAINKIDKDGANILKIRKELEEINILESIEEHSVSIVEVSALQNRNIDNLIQAILALAEKKSLLANPNVRGVGTILDSYLDKNQGPIANILVQDGSIKVGDVITTEDSIAKIRSILDKSLHKCSIIGPSCVVQISGFSQVPKSGSLFKVVDNEKNLKKLFSVKNKHKTRILKSHQKMNTRVTLDSFHENLSKPTQKNVNIILKTDSEGSIEAILNAFESIPQEKVQLNIVSLGVGEITSSDIELALISKSILIGFNSHLNAKIQLLANKANIVHSSFKVIYNLIDFIEQAMLEFVDVDYREDIIGQATVETVFSVSRGNVAGCIVKSGKFKRGSYIKVTRSNDLIYKGELSSLKRVKEDVEEVNAGSECGILCKKFDMWQTRDKLEAYELIEIAKTL